VLILPIKRGQVIGLDILRFLAAMVVMAFHLGVWVWAVPNSTGGMVIDRPYELPALKPFLWFGWVGVEIFFMISGFVIANSAEGSAPKQFALNRFIRLAPGIWICASISLLILLLASPIAPKVLAIKYLLTLVLNPIGHWIDGVYWTLVVEVIFYAMISCVLALRLFKKIDLVSAALATTSLLYWIATTWLGEFIPDRIAQFLLLQHGGAFAVGMSVWGGMLRRRSAAWWVAGVFGVVAVCLEIVHAAGLKAHDLAMQPVAVLPIVTFVLAAILLVVSVDLFKRDIAPGKRAGSWARTLGLATYPLYLLHTILGGQVIDLALAAGVGSAAALLIGACASVVAATVVAIFLEKPAQQRLKAYLRM
jgi:peptidoglycan/LPS O-acetylase OafA/YrhL